YGSCSADDRRGPARRDRRGRRRRGFQASGSSFQGVRRLESETKAIGRESTKPFDVVGFGFNNWDHVCVVDLAAAPDSKQRLRAHFTQPGGQVPTALVAMQRWGLSTAYVGPFGDDDGGELQRSSLVAERVDVSGCPSRPGSRSQISMILVDRVTGART